LKVFCRNAKDLGKLGQVMLRDSALSSHPAGDNTRMHMQPVGHPVLTWSFLQKDASERSL